MKNVLIVVLFTVAFGNGARSQNKPGYAAKMLAGIVAGGSGQYPDVHAITGVKYKGWFGGVGVGFDWYYYNSIPLYASFSRNIFHKGRQSFLILGDGGYNFSRKSDRLLNIYSTDAKTNGGLYYNAALGWRLGLGKANSGLLLQLGYSFKQLEEEVTYKYPCFNPPCQSMVEKNDYRFKRLSLRIGWDF